MSNREANAVLQLNPPLKYTSSRESIRMQARGRLFFDEKLPKQSTFAEKSLTVELSGSDIFLILSALVRFEGSQAAVAETYGRKVRRWSTRRILNLAERLEGVAFK
jgi:hypothetical protein